MHAVWIDEGTEVDDTKLAKYGINRPFLSHRDSHATAQRLQDLKARGYSPGLFSAWNWYPDLDGPSYAAELSRELRRIGWLGNPEVCIDIETHDTAYVLSFFREWRRLRPFRRTWWTFEGMQGGLFAGIARELNALNIRYVPQMYQGDMTPHGHSVIIDLLMVGFPGDRIDGFYDARALPYQWRGFAFTQARLP